MKEIIISVSDEVNVRDFTAICEAIEDLVGSEAKIAKFINNGKVQKKYEFEEEEEPDIDDDCIISDDDYYKAKQEQQDRLDKLANSKKDIAELNPEDELDISDSIS